MSKYKVFIEGESDGMYHDMFRNNGWETVYERAEANLLQLTGGEDVTPSLYGEEKHGSTFNNILRDHECEKLYQNAVMAGQPIAGICRGSQFLCAINGGKLWQDVSNHAIGGTHEIRDLFTGQILPVTSTHHQMHRPADNAIIISIASPQLATHKIEMVDGKEVVHLATDKEVWEEGYEDWEGWDTEVFYHSNTKSLGVQGHPEYLKKGSAFQDYYFELLERYFDFTLA